MVGEGVIKYECSIIVFKPKITSFYQLRICLVGDSRYMTYFWFC